MESSTFCNARCLFCPRYEMKRKMGEMSDEIFYKVIKDGKEINAKFYSPFLNGEPFVFPRIWEWLDYMKKEEVQFSLYTNAEFMDVDRLVSYPNVRYVNCSLNGATKETYDKIMRGPDYERSKKNIEELIKKANFRVQVSMVVTEDNVKEIDQFNKMWGKYSKMRSFKNWGGDRHSSFEDKGEKKPCWAVLNTMVILWDGRVVPCCMDYDGKLILGDIKKQSLKEIWHNSYWLREKHRKLDFSMIPCKECNYNAVCQ